MPAPVKAEVPAGTQAQALAPAPAEAQVPAQVAPAKEKAAEQATPVPSTAELQSGAKAPVPAVPTPPAQAPAPVTIEGPAKAEQPALVTPPTALPQAQIQPAPSQAETGIVKPTAEKPAVYPPVGQAPTAAGTHKTPVFGEKSSEKAVQEMRQPVGRKVIRTLTVEFDFNSSSVKPQYNRQLKKLADLMNASPGSTAKIIGHTDSVGNKYYNFRLSKQRAESVKRALSSFGADPSKITTRGYGFSQPIADNALPEGRQKNRRAVTAVTVLIYPGK
jgi:outer membrane protein OmpA-like peptidoglycan-associated protein